MPPGPRLGTDQLYRAANRRSKPAHRGWRRRRPAQRVGCGYAKRGAAGAAQTGRILMALVDRIREVTPLDFSRVRPLRVGGEILGWVPHAMAERLRVHDDVFEVGVDGVRLCDRLATFEARTDAVDRVVRA